MYVDMCWLIVCNQHVSFWVVTFWIHGSIVCSFEYWRKANHVFLQPRSRARNQVPIIWNLSVVKKFLKESNTCLQKNGKRMDFPATGLCNWSESLLGQCNHSLVKENWCDCPPISIFAQRKPSLDFFFMSISIIWIYQINI